MTRSDADFRRALLEARGIAVPVVPDGLRGIDRRWWGPGEADVFDEVKVVIHRTPGQVFGVPYELTGNGTWTAFHPSNPIADRVHVRTLDFPLVVAFGLWSGEEGNMLRPVCYEDPDDPFRSFIEFNGTHSTLRAYRSRDECAVSFPDPASPGQYQRVELVPLTLAAGLLRGANYRRVNYAK